MRDGGLHRTVIPFICIGGQRVGNTAVIAIFGIEARYAEHAAQRIAGASAVIIRA